MGLSLFKPKPNSAEASKVPIAKPAAKYSTPKSYKILLIGDSGVGKSALALRLSKGTFTDGFIQGIGDFVSMMADGIEYRLYDTAGQERFRTLTSSYYRGANVLVCCVDLTDGESFFHAEKWISEAQRYLPHNTKTVIVGTKADLQEKRVVDKEALTEFSSSIGVECIETSAKETTNMLELGEMIVELVKAKKDDE